jgi:hypothetical protein
MAETVGELPERAAVALLTPVHTGVVTATSAGVDTGRLTLVPLSGPTTMAAGPAGPAGAAVGRPVLLEALAAAPAGALVVLVPAGVGYAEAARVLNASPADVVAVVMADDEAVLLGHRLERAVPVVDQVAVEVVGSATRVAVEVAGSGRALARVVDPLWLSDRLGLDADERADATTVSRQLAGSPAGVVLLDADPAPVDRSREVVVRRDDGSWRLADASLEVADLVVVDVTGTAWPREPGDHRLVAAFLHGRDACVDPGPELSRQLGLEVVTVASEAAMGALGASTTPGADPDAAVLDLGAGTADLVVSGGATETRAGCGALLTLAVAEALGITRGAAEWVKRGPSVRVEGPTVRVGETGERFFDDVPAPASALGRLAVPGPAGLLGFGDQLPAATWRNARGALKEAVLARALRERHSELPSTLVVVGGPAGDDEALAALGAAVPPGTVVGRGDVAGTLGHRHAVAWGLALTAESAQTDT